MKIDNDDEARKLLDKTCKLFITKCSDKPLFFNKKMNPAYFAVRNYILKHPEISLQILFDYLQECSFKQRAVWVAMDGAMEYQKHVRSIEMAKRVQEIEVEYKEYSLEDLE